MTTEELPFVRGRTIIPEDLGSGDLVIAGHPNFLGIFDLPRAVPWIAVTGRWSSLMAAEGAIGELPLEPAVSREEAEVLLGSVRDLAKSVGQLRGVSIAFPPESPVLVALVAVDPTAIDLPGCTPLDTFEELPGGLRIEAPQPGYAAALEQAISAIEVEATNRWT